MKTLVQKLFLHRLFPHLLKTADKKMREIWEFLTLPPWKNEVMKKYLDNSPYKSIFHALLKDGHSEQEAEELICAVVEEQIDFTDYADRIHSIIKEAENPENWS